MMRLLLLGLLVVPLLGVEGDTVTCGAEEAAILPDPGDCSVFYK